ncbi:hypothetical protein SRHO_G00204860 [Serrasalmus rhombeus]
MGIQSPFMPFDISKLEVGSGTAPCPTPDTSDLWHLIQDDDTQWQDGLTASAIPAIAQNQPGHSEEQPSAMLLSASCMKNSWTPLHQKARLWASGQSSGSASGRGHSGDAYREARERMLNYTGRRSDGEWAEAKGAAQEERNRRSSAAAGRVQS